MYAADDQCRQHFHMHFMAHLRKPRILSPLRSLRVRNEVDLVPLTCEDLFGQTYCKQAVRINFIVSEEEVN